MGTMPKPQKKLRKTKPAPAKDEEPDVMSYPVQKISVRYVAAMDLWREIAQVLGKGIKFALLVSLSTYCGICPESDSCVR